MHIRSLSADDLPSAVALNNANIPAITEIDLADLTHLFSESLASLGAYEGDTLVGFSITFAPGADYESVNFQWFAERYTDFAYLDRIAVDDNYQGRGIGAALYADLEARIGAEWLTCEVNLRPRNDGSLRFHHRIGFEEVGQQETGYGVLVSMLAKRIG